MNIMAQLFDAPPNSSEHAQLRDIAWMGGDYVEGRYLLGMLISENLFKLSHAEYIRKLHTFIAARISDLAADILATADASQYLMPYLRLLYERETDYPSINGPKNERVERAIEYLLHNLDAGDKDIAVALGTTEKQIARLSCLTAARATIRHYRNRTSD